MSVAAVDAVNPGKYDVQLDGKNDSDTLQKVLDGMPQTGKHSQRVGTVFLSEGHFYLRRQLTLKGAVNVVGMGSGYTGGTVLVPMEGWSDPYVLHLAGDIMGRRICDLGIDNSPRWANLAGVTMINLDQENRRAVLERLYLKGDIGLPDGIRLKGQHVMIRDTEILGCGKGIWIEYRLNQAANIRTARCTYGLCFEISRDHTNADLDDASYNLVWGFENVAENGAKAGIYINGHGNQVDGFWDENEPLGYASVLEKEGSVGNRVSFLKIPGHG